MVRGSGRGRGRPPGQESEGSSSRVMGRTMRQTRRKALNGDLELRPGPATVDEVFDWPTRLMEDLYELPSDGANQGSQRYARMQKHQKRGMLGTSDFSGWESQAEASRLGTQAFMGIGPHQKYKGIQWVRTCDFDKVAQTALLGISAASGGSGCVFDDLFHRLPEDLREHVAAQKPSKEDSDDLSSEGHKQMQDTFRAYASIAFPVDATSPCLQHGQHCPVNPCAALDCVMKLHNAHEGVHGIKAKRRRTSATASKDLPWWRACEGSVIAKSHVTDDDRRAYLSQVLSSLDHASIDSGESFSEESSEDEAVLAPLIVNWGSTVCHGHSTLGKQRKSADPGEASHNLWIEERRQRGSENHEDVWFHENGPLYPKHRQKEDLQGTHEVISLCAGGFLFGLPYDRNRRLGAGWTSRFKWVGAEDYEAEFCALFSRSIRATGDVYLIAPHEEVQLEYKRLAAIRGFTLKDVDVVDLANKPEDAAKVLAPGGAFRINAYLKLRAERGNTDGVFLADLDHNPGSRGPASGAYFPTMDTHPFTYSFSKKRLCVGMDYVL